ncbi:hypothetical protein DET59_11177 [Rossellomorea aquimaris]|uniref:Uncharacterized protein n=1 Tax=Rossellomorea aquimaris TaxID=189382 RepID=A0A366EMP5_9BACI|nr:hypothetical protein DET59_11177 [Rossellomorea aquimaris]
MSMRQEVWRSFEYSYDPVLATFDPDSGFMNRNQDL